MSTHANNTIEMVLRQCTTIIDTHLEDNLKTPRLDAELLTAFVLECQRRDLIVNMYEPFPEEKLKLLESLVNRRIKNEPIAYILGFKEFWGLQFKVTKDVLIPRPDTEILVEAALEEIKARSSASKEPIRVLDLGTGSGCIIIAVGHECKRFGIPVQLTAVDKSKDALRVAMLNAKANGLGDDIKFIESDWFTNVPQDITFDMVLSNPPYLKQGDPLCGKEIDYEPEGALYADIEGYGDYETIFSQVGERLATKGKVFFECGINQSDRIIGIAKANGYAEEGVIRDLAGVSRVVYASPLKSKKV